MFYIKPSVREPCSIIPALLPDRLVSLLVRNDLSSQGEGGRGEDGRVNIGVLRAELCIHIECSTVSGQVCVCVCV